MLKQGIFTALIFIVSFPSFAEENINRVHISAPIVSVYQYITQPDKWHDWYPQSKSAKTPGGSLKAGQTFSEVVKVNQKNNVFNYIVVDAQAPTLWRVEYISKSVIGSIQYQLHKTIDGTILTRTLEYFPVPETKEDQLTLAKLSTQVQPTSIKALLQLKEILEADWQKK